MPRRDGPSEAEEIAALNAEIEAVRARHAADDYEGVRKELDQLGLTARSQQVGERQWRRSQRGKFFRNAGEILLGWIFVGVWVYALVRSWHAGIGWFLFWLILGPVVIATTMGCLGLGTRRQSN